MPNTSPHPTHTCPACGQEHEQVKSALACWLKAEPDALRTRSLREAGALLSCSYERVRQAANALRVDTSLAAKEPGFMRRMVQRAQTGVRVSPDQKKARERERAQRAMQALRADPERYEAYLERQRKRRRERWRTDPEYRRARTESMYRWRAKRQRSRRQ